MKTAPIILFVYNRPWHTRQTVEALQRNLLASESELIVFSDGPKKEADQEKIDEVREYIRSVTGFAGMRLVERCYNLGLATSVINGVTEVIEKYGRVIVMEDDLETLPHFLQYMNHALDFYGDDPQIGTVTGYSLPIKFPADYQWQVYLTQRHSSWGWGTYERVWRGINWELPDYSQFSRDRRARRAFNSAGGDMATMLDMQMAGELDSWSIRFDYACFKTNLLSIAPVHGLVRNIGFDGSGVHCGPDNSRFDTQLDKGREKIELRRDILLDPRIMIATRDVFPSATRARLHRYRNKLRCWLLRYWSTSVSKSV